MVSSKLTIKAKILLQMLRHFLKALFSIYRLCTDLTTLITERCEIERAYAKNLKSWSKKWGDLIEKGIKESIFIRHSIT